VSDQTQIAFSRLIFQFQKFFDLRKRELRFANFAPGHDPSTLSLPRPMA